MGAATAESILAHEGIDENLRFLILEVRKQLEQTHEYVKSRTPSLVDSVRSRDDYIDNLKTILQRKCFALAAKTNGASSVEFLRSIDIVTGNLERISDFCENIVKQLGYIEKDELLKIRPFGAFFDEILAGVACIEDAVFGRDVKVALQICRTENVLDRMYAEQFERILIELELGQFAQTLVTILFITHYFERMGDALLNIGEAVISACLGERIKIDEFEALEDSLELTPLGADVGTLALERIGETRSGCRIDRVSARNTDQGRSVIFKEGRLEKVRKEMDAIERWHVLVPGIAPKVYSFHEQGENAAILCEYLPGRTLEGLLVNGDTRELDVAMTSLCATLREVWTKTRHDEPLCAAFMAQLRKRLADVYTVHPEFRGWAEGIGGVQVSAFEALVESLAEVEQRVPAPFSIFGHGDFNADNIIYDGASRRVRFVDLHRSHAMDYVQDVSVFLVSNHRLQVFDAPVRQRIDRAILHFLEFAEEFARDAGDAFFEIRLALGLARSFATSTRFVLDEGFAKEMYLRARYLLERVRRQDPDQFADFRFPRRVILD